MKGRCIGFLAVICLLIWVTPLYASPAPEGFVGVKWGASRAEITAKMDNQGWVKLTGGNPDEIIFRGNFDGNPCQLRFVMSGNSLVKGIAMPIARFPVRNVAATGYTYNSIINHLQVKYGPATDTGEGQGMALSTWNFGDGVAEDKYIIHVMFNKAGTWFSDVDGVHTYIEVEYTAVSLEERLKNQNL